MLPISYFAGIISQSGGGTPPTTITISGSVTGTTNVPITLTFTLNTPATTQVTVTPTPSSNVTYSTPSVIAIGQSTTTCTMTRSTDGSHTVNASTSPVLTVVGGYGYSSSVVPVSADWTARSTGAGVVWAHNFEYDNEVTNHAQPPDPVGCPVPLRRVIDESGIGCLEQIALGATLASAFTAGSITMVINDATYWPNPAVTGSFYFYVSTPAPMVKSKNVFLCTARSGTTLTVSYFDMTGVSAFANTPQSYPIGSYAGNESGDWRRTFARLPAGENGKPTDDAGASGTVPLRSKLSGNAYSVPRDTSLWQYGWYGHPSNQTTWANWTGWQGTTSLTPRGVSQGAAAKFRLWDGAEFFVQFRMKIDPRFWALNVLPDSNGEDSYFGRKGWAFQSELSSLNQLVTGFSPSNRYSIPTTRENPFSLTTYKAARVIGVSDYPRTSGVSYQKGGPWDVTPYFANLSSSFKPSTGAPTPDGSAAWEYKSGEWITFLVRIKPGRSEVNETEIEVKFARTEDPSYTGAYTTLMNVTDARIVYSGSGDYDYPDGAFSYPTVPVMNALPGYQAFGIMGYFNGYQTAGIPPPMASYYVRMAQVIFSQATIAPPVADFPAWRRGQPALTWANIGTSKAIDVDPENNAALNPNGAGNPAPWRNGPTGSPSGGDIFRVWESWCTGIWNESSGRFRVHGGGHDDYAGNEVYGINLFVTTPTWALDRPPTGAIGNTGVLADGLENTGVYFDGRPRSSHTYCNLAIVNNEMWLACSAGPFRSGQGDGGKKTWRFNDATGDWVLIQAGTWPIASATGNAGSTCFDTVRNRLYYWPSENASVSYWDVAAGSSNSVGFITGFGRQSHAIYIPELDIQVCLTGQVSAGFVVYDYGRTAGSFSLIPGATGTAPAYAGYDPGWFNPNGVWVPSLGAILCWHGGVNFSKLTPPVTGNPATTPWAWSTFNAATGNTLDPGLPNPRGVYSRLFYSKRLKGIGLSTSPNLPVRFFALE